ncbi:hypothetical protein V5N11_000944 [Cardamine amara subsp. amara]|uniref:Transposase-associated domain-containing protein n=1 Tax=Cardamine amara subsp. amara TaxID=228776 RepID=A0ABD1C583_CARAN
MSTYFRSWMDEPMMNPESNTLNEEYARGIVEFMQVAGNQPRVQKSGKLICPCSICQNSRNVRVEIVWHHLYSNGFTPGYKIWYLHGERNYDYGSTSEPTVSDSLGDRTEVDVCVGTD